MYGIKAKKFVRIDKENSVLCKRVLLASNKIGYTLYSRQKNNGELTYDVLVTSNVFGEPEIAKINGFTDDVKTAYEMFSFLVDFVVLPHSVKEFSLHFLENKKRMMTRKS